MFFLGCKWFNGTDFWWNKARALRDVTSYRPEFENYINDH
jgi:hypothetical protein